MLLACQNDQKKISTNMQSEGIILFSRPRALQLNRAGYDSRVKRVHLNLTNVKLIFRLSGTIYLFSKFLGPLSFQINKNNLPKVIGHIRSKCIIHAGDTFVLVKHNRRFQFYYSEQFNLLYHRVLNNNLKLNHYQTQLLKFYLHHRHSTQNDSSYLQSRFNVVTSFKLPGVETDSRLTSSLGFPKLRVHCQIGCGLNFAF